MRDGAMLPHGRAQRSALLRLKLWALHPPFEVWKAFADCGAGKLSAL